MPFLNDWYANNGNLLIDILSAIVPVTTIISICIGVHHLFTKIPKVRKIIFFQ